MTIVLNANNLNSAALISVIRSRAKAESLTCTNHASNILAVGFPRTRIDGKASIVPTIVFRFSKNEVEARMIVPENLDDDFSKDTGWRKGRRLRRAIHKMAARRGLPAKIEARAVKFLDSLVG